MESSHGAQFVVGLATANESKPTLSCTLVPGRELRHEGFSESRSSSPAGRTRVRAGRPEPMDLCCSFKPGLALQERVQH